jgi:hypothetical protein
VPCLPAWKACAATFLDQHDIVTRLSCPYTSPQNGKAECMLRTINNTIRTLLIHAFMPSTYWVEALSTATFLINHLPSTKTPNTTPFQLLHNRPPTYSDLRVFGCLCYPNTSATATHKLSPRSVPCVFLGYPSSHKGCRCLNLVTQKLIISHHIIFDETVFPFHFRYPDGHGTSMDFLLPPASSPLMAQGAGLGDTPSSSASLLPNPKMMSSHWLPQYAGPGHRLRLTPMVRAREIHLHHRRLLLRAHPHRNRTRCMVLFTSMDPCMQLLTPWVLPRHWVCCMGLFPCMAMCPTLLQARLPGAAAPLLQFLTPSPYHVMRATLTRWSHGDRPVSPSS